MVDIAIESVYIVIMKTKGDTTMTSYVLRDKLTLKYLQKTDAWGHTLTDELQKARVYTSKGAATRTMTNQPSYAKDDLPDFELKEIKIVLA